MDLDAVWDGEWGHPGIDVLDGGPRASRGKGGFWGCLPNWPNGFNCVFCNKCIQLLHEKLIIFLYGQCIVGIYISLAFRRCTQVLGRCWGLRAIGKEVTVDTRKMDVPLHGAAATSWQPSASRPTLILSVQHQNTQ